MDERTWVIEWVDDFSVGFAEIDDQHKKLIEIFNSLAESIMGGREAAFIDGVVSGLREYVVVHFETEERYMREFNFEGYEEHRRIHNDFKDDLERILERYSHVQDDAGHISFELLIFLSGWLHEHLFNVDRKYVTCFRQFGLK